MLPNIVHKGKNLGRISEPGYKKSFKKGCVSVWGAQFIQFLAALGFFFPWSIRKKRLFLSFFQINRGKTASVARNWINVVPQTDTTTFAFASASILLLCFQLSKRRRGLCLVYQYYCSLCQKTTSRCGRLKKFYFSLPIILFDQMSTAKNLLLNL